MVRPLKRLLVFRSSHFLFLVTFGDKVTKILRNLCLHFARQDGQDGKKRKEKQPKYQKMKIRDKRKIGCQMQLRVEKVIEV